MRHKFMVLDKLTLKGKVMTPAELKTLRESLGLSVRWCAQENGINQRSWRYWESGTFKIPQDAIEWITSLSTLADSTAKKAIESILEQKDRPEEVMLIQYKTDKEMWELKPEMRYFPASYHAAILAKTQSELKKLRIKSTLSF